MIARTSESLSSGGTSNPVSPSIMASEVPTTLVEMTGHSAKAASTSTRPKPSHLDARTKMSKSSTKPACVLSPAHPRHTLADPQISREFLELRCVLAVSDDDSANIGDVGECAEEDVDSLLPRQSADRPDHRRIMPLPSRGGRAGVRDSLVDHANGIGA